MFSRFWSWLVSFFRKTPALIQESYDVYLPQDREIYSYFDGEKVVRVDPMPIYKKIMAIGPELSVDIKVARSPMKDAQKAHGAAVRKIREVFSIKEFDKGGLTEQESMDLLDHFLDYADSIKKNSSTSVISPPETSLPTSVPLPDLSGVGSVPNQPTTNTSDSGSTVSELSIDKLPQLPSGLPSHSETSPQA